MLGYFRFGVCRAAVGYTWWDIYLCFFFISDLHILASSEGSAFILVIKKGVHRSTVYHCFSFLSIDTSQLSHRVIDANIKMKKIE